MNFFLPFKKIILKIHTPPPGFANAWRPRNFTLIIWLVASLFSQLSFITNIINFNTEVEEMNGRSCDYTGNFWLFHMGRLTGVH